MECSEHNEARLEQGQGLYEAESALRSAVLAETVQGPERGVREVSRCGRSEQEQQRYCATGFDKDYDDRRLDLYGL